LRTVLCTGSRTWQDDETIYSALASIRKPFRIIVGDADGADKLFWRAAEKLGVPRLRYNAQWKLYRKAAGNKRNTVMLNVLRYLRSRGEEHCIVLSAWDGSSRGTQDMMDQARLAKFEVWLVSNFKGGT
jgi:hypothetical protein